MLQVLNIYCWVDWISTKFIKINEAIIVLIKESKSLLQSPKKYDYLIFIEIFKYLRFIIDIWHNFLHQFEELQISWNFHYLFRWWDGKLCNSSRNCCKGNASRLFKIKLEGEPCKKHHYTIDYCFPTSLKSIVPLWSLSQSFILASRFSLEKLTPRLSITFRMSLISICRHNFTTAPMLSKFLPAHHDYYQKS